MQRAQARIQGGGGFGGRDPPPALDHQFCFSTNFLTSQKKKIKKNRSEYSMDAMYLNLMFINPRPPVGADAKGARSTRPSLTPPCKKSWIRAWGAQSETRPVQDQSCWVIRSRPMTISTASIFYHFNLRQAGLIFFRYFRACNSFAIIYQAAGVLPITNTASLPQNETRMTITGAADDEIGDILFEKPCLPSSHLGECRHAQRTRRAFRVGFDPVERYPPCSDIAVTPDDHDSPGMMFHHVLHPQRSMQVLQAEIENTI